MACGPGAEEQLTRCSLEETARDGDSPCSCPGVLIALYLGSSGHQAAAVR